MNQDSLVTTYTQGSGVDETDTGTGSQQDFFDEDGQGGCLKLKYNLRWPFLCLQKKSGKPKLRSVRTCPSP